MCFVRLIKMAWVITYWLSTKSQMEIWWRIRVSTRKVWRILATNVVYQHFMNWINSYYWKRLISWPNVEMLNCLKDRQMMKWVSSSLIQRSNMLLLYIFLLLPIYPRQTLKEVCKIYSYVLDIISKKSLTSISLISSPCIPKVLSQTISFAFKYKKHFIADYTSWNRSKSNCWRSDPITMSSRS